jgi:ethanolamine utilization protein EutQ (cupin superfamily)
MFEIVELAAFAIFILFFAWLIVANVKLRLQNNKMKSQLSQEIIDREIVMQEMQKLMAEIDSKNSNQNDGFLKFVSDSREAAFKYIEEVQKAIVEFDARVGPAVRYYKQTGKMLDRRPSELVRDLAEAYDKLMQSMPKEETGSD